MSSFSVGVHETAAPYAVFGPHVILVEDDETQGWSISRTIERQGADCTLITDLAAAEQMIPTLLSTAQPYRPTILLMDQQLPYNGAQNTGVDGWTLMAELLGQMHAGVLHPALLVAISADLYGDNRDFYNQQMGAHACLEKPIRDQQVHALLERVQAAVPPLPPPLHDTRPHDPMAQQRWSIGDLGRRALRGLRQMVRRQRPEIDADVLKSFWRRDATGALSLEALTYLQTLGLTFEAWSADRAAYIAQVYPDKPYSDVFCALCQLVPLREVAIQFGYSERQVYRIETTITDILVAYEYQQQKGL